MSAIINQINKIISELKNKANISLDNVDKDVLTSIVKDIIDSMNQQESEINESIKDIDVTNKVEDDSVNKDEGYIEVDCKMDDNDIRNIIWVRNQYLYDSDKYLLEDYPISIDKKKKVKKYRKYLRDYPLNSPTELPKTLEEWLSEEL